MLSHTHDMFEALLGGKPASLPPEPADSYAFFMGGLQTGSVRSDHTDRYQYSDSTITTGIALLTTRYRGAAAGNGTVALYAGGTTTGTTATTERYTFAGQSIAAGTSLPAGRAYPRAAGNLTQGFFVGGSGSTRCDGYLYASDTYATAQALSAVRYNGGAAGNATLAVFAQGYNGTATLNTSVIYTHADNLRVNGTNLTTSTQGSLGVGDATHGLFGAGNSGLFVLESYTYANNSVASAANISQSVYTGAAAGNKTTGVLAGGGPTTSNTVKLTYAGDTRANTGQLGQLRTELSAASSAMHF